MNKKIMNAGQSVRRRAVAVMLGMLMAAPVLAQKAYDSAEAAANAFQAAVAKGDKAALGTVLGKNWKTFIPDKSVDQEDIDLFLAGWNKAHRIVSLTPGKSLLEVGDQGWTLPVPIVKAKTGWKFDPVAGADEMRTRRIGRNELATIQVTLAYFDAQKEYASQDRNGDGVLEYAQKFKSSTGKHDGLYWQVSGSEPESPLGPRVADIKPGDGYYGYRYKILKGQGKAAPGGAYSYLIKGRMVSGFALVAWPLRYGDTGVMSFVISHDGELYEKNLGAKSAEIASNMKSFNPDEGWSKVPLPASAMAGMEKK
jgi:hypothetical protein